MKFGNFLKAANNAASNSITTLEFKNLFEDALKKIPSKRSQLETAKIALSVSGGLDSMALAALAVDHFGADRVIGLIVDHNLGSQGVSEDPLQVQQNLNRLGLRSEILSLSWEQGELSSMPNKLMQFSRDNRYKSLFEGCRRNNAPILLTGHNLDDDIVTMFYRMSRMSGLDGIAGMKSVTTFPFPLPDSDSYFIVRPLISVPKSRIINTCVDRKIPWIHDQSNEDLNFRRNETLQAIISLQDENPLITTESLAKMLKSFKSHRSFIHQKVSNSVIFNKNVGDATLIINSPELVQNNFLFNRVLTALVQFVTVSPYPPKTQSLNRLFEATLKEYEKYKREMYVDAKSRSRYSLSNKLIAPETKRMDLSQHTLSGALVYALSKNDTARRLNCIAQKTGRKLISGPGILIQREGLSKSELKLKGNIQHDFWDGKAFLWDNRIFIQITPIKEEYCNSLIFSIQPLSSELVKKFEKLTARNSSIRKKLYEHLGMTPASHLHPIPVLIHEESGYMAMPTLLCQSEGDVFNIKYYNASSGVLVSKFSCLP